MTVRYLAQLLCLMTVAYLTETQITKGPSNTAVKQGDSAILECEANIPAGDNLVWLVHINDGSGERIYMSGEGIEPDVEGYEIIEGQNRYNLKITSAKIDKAELHTCRILKLDNDKSAELLVLDSVSCAADKTVQIGEEIMFSCSVNFYGDNIEPRLALKLGGATLRETSVIVDNTLSFQHNISADALAHDDRDFNCDVFFDNAGVTGPVYTDRCTTHIFVKHAPRELKIYPDPDGYDEHIISLKVGDNITCTAKGRPTPSIWFSKGNSTEHDVEGGLMEIGTEHIGRHVYWCNAQNNAGNRVNIERKDFTIDVSPGPGGSTGGVPGLISHSVSRIIAQVSVVLFALLLHSYS